MIGAASRPAGYGHGSRKHTGRQVLAASLAFVLGIASCSDRMAGQGGADRVGGTAGGDGFFVDREYLTLVCISSGVAYPIKAEERTIDGSEPTARDATILKRHREIIEDAFGAYARRFFEAIGLRKIVLCRGLKIDGVSGHAFADVERGTLFVAIDSGMPDDSLRRSLHHEVFHFVDFAEDGRLDEDPAWSALNPPTFSYGQGGASMQDDPDAGRPDAALVGFVDRYATSGLAEDKAEVYALLIVDRAWMLRRAEDDPILGRKTERVRIALRHFGPLAPDISHGQG